LTPRFVPAPPAVRAPAPPRTLALLAAALAAFAASALVAAWVCDDAFITARTIHNLLHGYGLRWNVAERVQVSSHPLWLLVWAGASAATHEYFYTPIVLGLGLSLAAALVVALRVAPGVGLGALGVWLLALSRAFTDYSTSGLENPLVHLLLALFLWRVLRAPQDGAAPTAPFVLAGLLLCTRLDTAPLVLPALVATAWRSPARATLRGAARGAVLPAAWLLFALVYFGFALPNPAPAKLRTGIEAAALAGQGLAYLADAWRRDPLTPLVVLAGLGAALVRRDRRGLGVAAGSLLHLVWVVSVGGDFMSGRFSTPAFLAAVCLLLACRPTARWAAAAAATAAVVGLTLPSARWRDAGRWRGPDGRFQPERAVDARGIADERAYYAPQASLLRARGWPTWPSPESADLAAHLRRDWLSDAFLARLVDFGVLAPGEAWPDVVWQRAARGTATPVAVRGAIGYLGFYAGPGLHVLDFHALADPLLARLPALERDPILPVLLPHVGPQPWRPGHYVRAIPRGYLASLATGEVRLEDPELAACLEALWLVTRGPLFAPARLRAGWDLHRGRWNAVLRAPRTATGDRS
jgi:arabinofuranosyltransferase